jgi:glycerophosphoryl diester phosphodiesterase
MTLRSLVLFSALLVLSCSPAKKYQALPEVLAWEKDIQKFEELDKTESYPDNSILFMGSSSIRLWSTLEKDMAPYPAINRGFGGSRLSDFTVYTDRIVSPHPCSAIVVFIANDITGGENDKSPEEVADLFSYMLKTIRKTHPSTPVFWIAVTPSMLRWKVWPVIQEAGKLIEERCRKVENTFYVKTDFAFLGESGAPKEELFRSDKLHLNEKGYEVWSKILKNEIMKIVPIPAVQIIGHRGASYLAPENTVASAILAWELGADAVECDIHLSKDNRVIVSHDATTKRTSLKDYTIKDTESTVLRTLDAGSFKDDKYKGEKIPFLEELIQIVPAGKELVIEIKCGTEVLPFLKDLIGQYKKDKQFVFIAFDINTISETKKLFPENRCYWLCSNKELLQKNIRLVQDAGLEGISLSYGIIDKDVAAQARKLNLELFTWTVDNPDEAKRLIALGVKGITTNRPGWLDEEIGMK